MANATARGCIDARLVLVAVGALGLLATQVAQSVDPASSPFGDNLLVRLDGGTALVVAAATLLTWEDRRRYDGTTMRWLGVRLGGLWGLWWATVGLAALCVRGIGGRDALYTAVLVRPRGSTVLALGVGRVLFAVFLAVVVVGIARELERRGTPAAPWTMAMALFIVGWLARLGLAADVSGAWERIAALTAHLDHVGLGLAAGLGSARRADRPWASRRTATSIAAALVLSGLLAAWALANPLTSRTDGAGQVAARAVAAALVVTGVMAASVTIPVPTNRRLAFAVRGLAVVAPGLLLGHGPAFVIVARHYPERLRENAEGLLLASHALPSFVWPVIIAAAVGIMVTWLASVLRASGRSALLRSRLTPLTLLAVAFLVRFAALAHLAAPRTDGGDPRYYHVTANLLAAGRGFYEPLNWFATETERPTALHGPLYPIVLSVSSRFGGVTYFDHKMVSLLIGTALVSATVVLGGLIGGRRVGLVAGAFAALYPNLWLLDSLLFPETLAALIMTISVIIAYRWRAEPRFRLAAALGASIGLGSLARGEGLLLIPLLVLPAMLATGSLRLGSRIRHVVMVGVVFGAVVAPWSLRNLTTFEEFVPLSTNGNQLHVYSNCDTVYAGEMLGFWDFNCEGRLIAELGEPPGDESQTALYWRDVGFRYARAHIDRLPVVLTARLARQWELFRPLQNAEFAETEGRNLRAEYVGLASYYFLAAASIVGFAARRRARLWSLPLMAPFAAVSVTALFAYGNIRFRAPAEPMLCVLAAYGVIAAAAHPRRWRRRATV